MDSPVNTALSLRCCWKFPNVIVILFLLLSINILIAEICGRSNIVQFVLKYGGFTDLNQWFSSIPVFEILEIPMLCVTLDQLDQNLWAEMLGFSIILSSSDKCNKYTIKIAEPLIYIVTLGNFLSHFRLAWLIHSQGRAQWMPPTLDSVSQHRSKNHCWASNHHYLPICQRFPMFSSIWTWSARLSLMLLSFVLGQLTPWHKFRHRSLWRWIKEEKCIDLIFPKCYSLYNILILAIDIMAKIMATRACVCVWCVRVYTNINTILSHFPFFCSPISSDLS